MKSNKPANGNVASPAKRIALSGMLFALALALSWLESLLTPLLGLPPGVKIGLANMVVLYALLFLGAPQALLLVVLKAGFAFLTRGGVAGLFSGMGGLLSLAVMALLLVPGRLARKKGKPGRMPSVLLLSVAGSLCHNAGQMLGVWLVFGPTSLYYAPVLAVSGIVMGCLTAAGLRVMLPALEPFAYGPKGGLRSKHPEPLRDAGEKTGLAAPPNPPPQKKDEEAAP